MIWFLVFIAREETAAYLDLKFHLKLFLLVQRADELLGIHNFHSGIQLDITGGHCAFFIHRNHQHLRVARLPFEKDFLEIEDDVCHVLDHSFNDSEFVHRTVHFDGGDSGAFKRGKEHSANRIADGVPVSGLKRFSKKLRVCIRRGGVLFGQPLRHFKTT